MTIKIIDTYSNGEFDPAKWVAEGYSGVMFKAGQGSWADVPRYRPDWWQRAKDAGLKRGWYWVCDSRYHSSKHLDEMDNWNLFADLGELGLWADVEKPIISMTETDYWKTTYAGPANIVDFVYLLRGRGVNVGVYTGPGAFELTTRGATKSQLDYLALSDLWTANYPYNYIEGVSEPTLYGSWTKWTWWQWREGPDVNIFNGTDAEFEAKYGASVIIPPPPKENQMQVTAKQKINIRSTPEVINSPSNDVGDFQAGQVAEVLELYPASAAPNTEQWARIAQGWVAVYYGAQLCTLSGTLTPPPASDPVTVEVKVNGAVVYSYP